MAYSSEEQDLRDIIEARNCAILAAVHDIKVGNLFRGASKAAIDYGYSIEGTLRQVFIAFYYNECPYDGVLVDPITGVVIPERSKAQL